MSTVLVKTLISLTIILSTSLIGYIHAYRYSQRVQQLRYILHGLQLLETEVLYSSNTLLEAMRRVGERSHPSVGGIFLETYKSLYNREGISLAEAWARAVETQSVRTSLEKMDKEVLIDFGKGLGLSDKENQKKIFQLTMLEIQKQQQAADDLKSKNEKMCKSLGVLIGIGIVIVLI